MMEKNLAMNFVMQNGALFRNCCRLGFSRIILGLDKCFYLSPKQFNVSHSQFSSQNDFTMHWDSSSSSPKTRKAPGPVL